MGSIFLDLWFQRCDNASGNSSLSPNPQHTGKPIINIYPQISENTRVRLVPDLSVAALRHKLDKELTLWYCLRAINLSGSGNVGFRIVIDALIDNFNYDKKTAYRHLKLGEGRFWATYKHNGSRRIKICSLKKVAKYLNTCLPGNKYFVEIPIVDFPKSLQGRRSLLWASQYRPMGISARPISRQSLEDKTGIDRRQQRRYEVVAGVRRTPNYAMYENNRKCRGTAFHPLKQLVVTRTKQYYVNKRLGNIYHSQTLTSKQGMLKKVSRDLRRGSLISDEAPAPKRYFNSFTKLLRAFRTRAEDSYYLIHNRKRMIRGRLEWCLVPI